MLKKLKKYKKKLLNNFKITYTLLQRTKELKEQYGESKVLY